MGPLSRFAPPVVVMVVIFALSAQPDLDSGFGAWDLPLRKLAHMGIFAILWLTVARALDWRRPVVTTLFTLLYAVSDEVHQHFVEGRAGTPVDVGIDAVGVLAGVLAFRRTAR